MKYTLIYIKSTKNKHVYGLADSPIESVYIDKSALPSKPDSIDIEIIV